MPDLASIAHFIFGRLTIESLPLHEPIVVGTFIVVAIGGAAVAGLLLYFNLLPYLWKEWFTSVDHKKIGIMYMVLGLVMLLRGFSDAIMMRLQQAIAFNGMRRLPAGASLRSGVHRPWRDHDLFRGHAVRDRGSMNFRCAAADRRARRILSVPEQFQFLDDRRRRRYHHDVAVRR